MKTFALPDGYDRSKNPATSTYRAMTVEEAKQLSGCSHALIRSADGKARRVKVNGQPKTWKRDAGRVEVPVKYGMYEYATLRNVSDGPDGVGECVGNGVAFLIVAV